ncbi:MAG: hypothetical protein J6D18_00620 [Erysipelotrichaceae bacterium]|nr:hypothetical protein [Erysipelotrichaceae bacterium]
MNKYPELLEQVKQEKKRYLKEELEKLAHEILSKNQEGFTDKTGYEKEVLPYWKRYNQTPVDPSVRIPNLDKIHQQIQATHLLLPPFHWLGWDYTLDEQGDPVLIEFNVVPGFMTGPLASGQPMFGECTDWILNDSFFDRTLENPTPTELIG